MYAPSFYDESKVGQLYSANTAAAMAEGQTLGLTPAAADKHRVLLFLVDPQTDFIHPDGNLAVPGAIDDTIRTNRWILNHLGEITDIAASLDDHIPYQIFFPSWWVDANGNHPAGFTPISAADVDNHVWIPLIEKDWSRRYVHELEAKAKKTLMIWPYHCLIGSSGNNVVPSLHELIMFHSAARASQPTWLHKGNIAKTEHYSPLEPEVKVPEHPQGGLNTAFLKMLGGYDLIFVAGQAKSHCVLEMLNSVDNYFDNDPATRSRVCILTDCMSTIPGFEEATKAAYSRFASRGARLLTTADPIK